jgi:hypothetical protein
MKYRTENKINDLLDLLSEDCFLVDLNKKMYTGKLELRQYYEKNYKYIHLLYLKLKKTKMVFTV